MKTMMLRAENLTKVFNRRPIFSDLSFETVSGESMAITGKNGAGKSTLVKILSGLLSPSSGNVTYQEGEETLRLDSIRPRIGFVAPYLQLYEEFSALENLDILSKIRDEGSLDLGRIENLFRIFNLWPRRSDPMRTFSSGMKQRVKYIVALSHNPSILFLDEPTANLDEEGIEAVRSQLQERENSILVLATNDEREAAWCGKRIHVGP